MIEVEQCVGNHDHNAHEAHLREEEALHRAHVREEEIVHEIHVREEEELHRQHEREEHDEHKPHGIEVTIRLPTDKWSHRFPENELVYDVIVAALSHFTELADKNPANYQLRRKEGDSLLAPNQTLAASGVCSGEVLKLIPPDGGGQ